MVEASEFSRLLTSAENRPDAWRTVLPLVFDELRAMASARLARERPAHTLQATALVNEAWIRVFGGAEPEFETRRHFFGAAARAMQQILTDHARRALAEKRGRGAERLTLTGVDLASTEDPRRAIEVADALDGLEREDERAAEVARLRLFAGLEVAEVARALSTSERTVAREWAYARARLTQLLGEGEAGAARKS